MTSAMDQRLTIAAEYLASARQHKVTHLPPSVLVRECAELRRQLGCVIAAAVEQAAIEAEGLAGLADRIDAQLADEHADRQAIAEDAVVQLHALGRIVRDGLGPRRVVLDEDQAATVLDALDVAAEYRVYRASLTCDACGTHPAELCDDHQADLEAAEQYHAIAAQLGGDR